MKAAAVDYSRLCRTGHVIDVLELRRLSSRGVPDEPPPPPRDHRDRHDRDDDDDGAGIRSHPASGNPQASYRPLVWRVLLGYLPPQTDSWNDVLSRDRRLYDSLVEEFFDGTCPRPHDLLPVPAAGGRGGGGGSVLEDNELHRRGGGGGGERNNDSGAPFTIEEEEDDDDDDDVAGEDVNGRATPTGGGSSDPPPPPPPPQRTPLTPGLLSARMQQEWVRGEMSPSGNNDSLFDAQNDNGGTGGTGTGVRRCGSGGGRERLSPMCAMNTPRNRSSRGAAYRKGGGGGGRDDDAPMTLTNTTKPVVIAVDDRAHSASSCSYADGRPGVVGGPSLLLPVDDDDDDDDDDEDDDEDDDHDGVSGIEKTAADTPDSSPGGGAGTLRRSVSITKASGDPEGGEYAEGVELCRRESWDDAAPHDDDDAGAISPCPPNRMGGGGWPETDEEENAHLLDEIRKDVIRTHPDLRFFLEPREDLGQKRYAALERILFVWAKLNKGVSFFWRLLLHLSRSSFGRRKRMGALFWRRRWSAFGDLRTHAISPLSAALLFVVADLLIPYRSPSWAWRI